MKLVILDGYALTHGDLSWQALSAFEGIDEIEVYDRTSKEMVVERAKDADLILTNKTRLRVEQLKALPKLKYIGVLATGYNIVDVDFAKEQGIVVTNVPSYGTDAVAQFVFAQLLEICHQIRHHSDAVKSGRWNQHEDFCFWDTPLIELAGKTIGLIGYGRIGERTAEIAKAFGMKVRAYKPSAVVGSGDFVSLETLLKQSDVISLHCPLTEHTRHILDALAFEQMKHGVIILNTARGPLIDEEALYQHLKSGKVLAAGLDVLAVEPPKGHHPLFDLPNCFITPHIAWAPKEARERLLDIAIENVKSYVNGQPQNEV